MKTMRLLIITALCSPMFVSTAIAEPACATNKEQRLMCSKHPEGFIYLNRKGQAVCSNGNCVTNASGLTLCSNKAGGAAWLDQQGFVICEGGCDAASALNCQLGKKTTLAPNLKNHNQ